MGLLSSRTFLVMNAAVLINWVNLILLLYNEIMAVSTWPKLSCIICSLKYVKLNHLFIEDLIAGLQEVLVNSLTQLNFQLEFDQYLTDCGGNLNHSLFRPKRVHQHSFLLHRSLLFSLSHTLVFSLLLYLLLSLSFFSSVLLEGSSGD